MEKGDVPMPTVLVVDDDVNYTLGVRDWLEDHGVRVVCAVTFAEALVQIQIIPSVDVVLLDGQLDGVNQSTGLISWLKEKFTSCVLVTISDCSDIRAEHMRHGCHFVKMKQEVCAFTLELLNV